jgi:preprotein translocase subunit SecY
MVDRCLLVIEIIIWLLVIICCVNGDQENSCSIRRTTSGDFEQDMLGGNRQWIPLKLNASGVMPIILRNNYVYSSCLAGLSKSDTSQSIVGAFSNMFGF